MARLKKTKPKTKRVPAKKARPRSKLSQQLHMLARYKVALLVVILFFLGMVAAVSFTGGAASQEGFAEHLAGTGLILLVAFFLAGAFISQFEPGLFDSPSRIFFLGLLALILTLLASTVAAYFLPLVLVAILLAIVYNQRFALGMMIFFMVPIGLGAQGDYKTLATLFAGSVAAIFLARDVRHRSKLIEVGTIAGFSQFAMLFALTIMEPAPQYLYSREVFLPFLWVFANGLAAGVIITALLPYIERVFNITTNIGLLELSDLNRPLLKHLALEAPGSYNHSLIVGNLAEAAARQIGANDLLARVSAYYHDIGKLNKPQYFVENEGLSPSKHQNLSPAMSSLIITAHTKDGLELAKEYKLPKKILKIIQEHHGSTLVEYFYHQAKEQNQDNHQVEESAFRYPGPLPRSKESAIVMLADAVESASRTMKDPSPAHLEQLVHDIIVKRLLDGQLNESNLTFRELHQIEISFIKVLAGIYHARIKYPEQEEK
jgi:hypothetical protein